MRIAPTLFATIIALTIPSAGMAQAWLRSRGPHDLPPADMRALEGAARTDPLDAEPTHWQYAFEFQRDELELPRPPSPRPNVAEPVLEALRLGCRSDDVELAVLSLLALAKIERTAPTPDFAKSIIAPALQRPAPVCEVAALALGIGAPRDKNAATWLADLANGDPDGRALVGQKNIEARTRVFAVFGIGLLAGARPDKNLPARALADVERLFLPDAMTDEELRVVGIQALGQVNLDGAPTVVDPMLKFLSKQWETVQLPWRARMQVPAAWASLFDATDPNVFGLRPHLFMRLQDESVQAHQAARRASVLALGRLCLPRAEREVYDDPPEKGPMNGPSNHMLESISESNGRDQQTRYFALLGLGTIGGPIHRATLLTLLQSRNTNDRAWAALAMGVCAARSALAASKEGKPLPDESQFGSELTALLKTTTDPLLVDPLATAIGMCRYSPAAETLRAMFNKAGVADSVGLALGMLHDNAAASKYADLARRTTSNGNLLKGWAMLDPEHARKAMLECLSAKVGAESQRYAWATAMRGDGDAATCAQIATLLADASLPLPQRRAAALALGSLCDFSLHHWSAHLASLIDYRDATPSMLGPYGLLRLP